MNKIKTVKNVEQNMFVDKLKKLFKPNETILH